MTEPCHLSVTAFGSPEIRYVRGVDCNHALPQPITLTPDQERELLEFAWPHWISRDRFPEFNHLLNVLIARRAARDAQ
jgi:hypothetical protein